MGLVKVKCGRPLKDVTKELDAFEDRVLLMKSVVKHYDDDLKLILQELQKIHKIMIDDCNDYEHLEKGVKIKSLHESFKGTLRDHRSSISWVTESLKRLIEGEEKKNIEEEND